ncbi:hypothetical protein quinque_013914 [Culex quinquefasciatus]
MDVPESEQKPNCFHQNDSYNMDFAMVMTVPVYKPLPQPAAKAPDKRRLPLPSRVHLDKSVVHVEEGRPPDDLVLAGEPELKCSRSTQSRSHSEPASSEMHVVNQSRKRHKSVSNLSNLTPYKFANVDTSRRVPSIQITNRQRWCTIWFLIAQVQSQPVALKLVISMIGPQAQPCKRRSNLREFHAVLPAIEDVGERREPADQSAAIHRKRCVGRAKELRDLNGGSMFGTNEARNPTVTTICVADDEGETSFATHQERAGSAPSKSASNLRPRRTKHSFLE